MTSAEHRPPSGFLVPSDCLWTSETPNQPQHRLQYRGGARYLRRSYPSPPMSGPPSPARTSAAHLPEASTIGDVSMLSTSDQGSAQLPTTLPDPPSSLLPPPTVLSDSQDPTRPLTGGTTSNPDFPAPSTPPEGAISVETPASRRGGRRSKAHVANACGNCKRAHLSCDPQRPCNRCVATGKGDSCRDVPHKKRGRPRLREEGEFRLEPIAGPSNRQVQTDPARRASQVERPVAGVRHRRGDSLRTLKSFGSSPSAASTISPTYRRPASRSWPQPRMPDPSHPFVVPVAFMDLDLVLIRANAAFQQLFADIQDIRGRRLTDIATPTDGDNFQGVRNQLREEREMRDPTYLPPILQSGQDPLGNLDETDLERSTAGFVDRQFFWTYTLAGGAEQTLASRVRLGKSSVYFVALTLPPLPQAPTFVNQAPTQATFQSPSTLLGPPLQAVRPFVDTSVARQQFPLSAPPSPFFPQPPGYPMMHPQSAGTNFSQSPQNYFPAPRPSPMQPLAGPSGSTPSGDPFTPQFGSRRLSISQAQVPPPSMGFQPPQQSRRTPPPSLQTVQPGQVLPSQHYPQSQHLHQPQHPQYSQQLQSARQPQQPQPPQQLQRGQSSWGLQLPQPQLSVPGPIGRGRRDTLGRIVSGRPLSSEGEGEEDPSQSSPRKRRRMEIDTVLQTTRSPTKD